MPNIKSQAKRLRQNEKRRLRNRYFRGRARTFIKKARKAMDEGNLDAAREFTAQAIKALDKAAEKGILHKNNVARRKSRLMKRLAAFEQAQAE
ncbi:MAG TPA: 30S ribosomal protein S20 [Chloroflexi bacterium]|nr:30S ribosomal protein S20 [Chloroflexota bacterium]